VTGLRDLDVIEKNVRNLRHRSLLCNLELQQAVTWSRTNAMFSGRVSQFRFTCSGSCVTDRLPRDKERRQTDWPYTYNIPSAVDAPLQSIGPNIARGQQK
jgi:hypothetical protein